MKNYGKRKIPRNSHEFRDLIGPLYYGGKYSESIDILISYWKRKGKSYGASSDILPGLFACSFKRHINIDGRFILLKYGVSTSEFVYDNIDEFISYFMDKFLIEYRSVKYFLKTYYRALDWEFPIDLKEKYKSKEEIINLSPKELKYNRSWEYGLVNNRVDIMTNSLIVYELKKIVASATKEFRENKGLSPVVVQWASEQYLLDKIKTIFSDQIVIGQGSPCWLEGQRFDVWLPEVNLAIEYNGLQHYEPVEHFGGVVGFEATKKRDEQKRIKCNANDTSLLEVREGYKFETVENWIKEKLNTYINTK